MFLTGPPESDPEIFGLRPAVALAFTALLVPLALAQGHQHEGADGMAMLLHDGPNGGRAVVGAFTHFGFVLVKDGMPQAHRNAEFNVTLNGAPLFATTDTHEYDGHFGFDVVFPTEGAYEVVATSEGMMAGRFNGTVVAPVNETEARIVLETVPTVEASRGFEATLSIEDALGRLIPHTDAIVELREAASKRLLSRTHLHIHEDPITFRQTPPLPGDYEISVVAYSAFQSGRVADVRPVLATFPVSTGALPAGANAPGLAVLDAAPLEPIGAVAENDGARLVATHDPQQLVGLGNPTRLAGIVLDANGTPIPHVDFTLELNAPDGLLFGSDSLHEYDGVFELLFTPMSPGFYRSTLTAHTEAGDLTVAHLFEVAPPVAPLDPGAFEITVDGVDGLVAGTPFALTFTVMGPTGPLTHSEVDVTVFRDGEPPIYAFKLHTHETGSTAATLLLPSEGTWQLAIDPVPLMPQASVVERAVFALEAAPGALPAPTASLDAADEALESIPLSLAPLLAAGVVAALLARRRR